MVQPLEAIWPQMDMFLRGVVRNLRCSGAASRLCSLVDSFAEAVSLALAGRGCVSARIPVISCNATAGLPFG